MWSFWRQHTRLHNCRADHVIKELKLQAIGLRPERHSWIMACLFGFRVCCKIQAALNPMDHPAMSSRPEKEWPINYYEGRNIPSGRTHPSVFIHEPLLHVNLWSFKVLPFSLILSPPLSGPREPRHYICAIPAYKFGLQIYACVFASSEKNYYCNAYRAKQSIISQSLWLALTRTPISVST